jgi:hypothetical protein
VAKKSQKKPFGDVLGISRARVSAPLPRKSASSRRKRSTAIEQRPRAAMRPARIVGGVRGKGI